MKHLRARFAGAALAAAAIAGTLTVAAFAQQQPARSTKPLVTWAGSYSAITQSGFARITSTEDWAELWKRHAGENAEIDSYGQVAAPEIDFQQCIVIALFAGQRGNTRAASVDFIDEFDDHLRIRYDWLTYQTAEEPSHSMAPGGAVEQPEEGKGDDAQAVRRNRHDTTPYGIIVIPRTTKRIVFEENMQGMTDPAPIWKQQAKLETLAP